MDELQTKDYNLEIGKTYDIVYMLRYDINYLSSAKLYKITAKMYFFDLPGGKDMRLRKDSICKCELSAKQL